MSPTQILDLPFDIQQLILKELLTSNDPLNVGIASLDIPIRSLKVPVLRSCKTFYAIGIELLYKQNTFRFFYTPMLWKFACQTNAAPSFAMTAQHKIQRRHLITQMRLANFFDGPFTTKRFTRNLMAAFPYLTLVEVEATAFYCEEEDSYTVGWPGQVPKVEALFRPKLEPRVKLMWALRVDRGDRVITHTLIVLSIPDGWLIA